MNSILYGITLVIDEFDSSFHYEIVTHIINIFNDLEVNKSGAQLIFNTHNPIYMDANILRRDQITLVEKDSETYKSSIYRLSDIKTTEPGGRNDSIYLKNYKMGSYGAIPTLDIHNAMYDIVNDEKID